MKYKKTEILLTVLSSTLAIIVGLALIRWLQPSLLGLSNDMVLVDSNEKIVPYYENIFRQRDFLSNEFILKDPYVKGRSRQFFPDMYMIGPHDVLGFRNQMVPNDTDIIVIGDSQTYGNNAHMYENWPHFMREYLNSRLSVYSMATGGWGAVQYYYMALKAPIFTPKIIIIAFYTGNDPLETFSLVYASERWKDLITKPELDKADTPTVIFPEPEEQQLQVIFSDGIKTIFTPSVRNSSNMPHPAVDAGYESILKIAGKIADFSLQNNIHPVFTIIPTKELVYSDKVMIEKISVSEVYKELIKNEQKRINELAKGLKAIKRVTYVDIIDDLKKAAMNGVALYPEDTNGHPVAEGYKIIGSTIANELDKIAVLDLPIGLAVAFTTNNEQILIFIKDNKYWFINSVEQDLEAIQALNLQTLRLRDLATLNYQGHKNLEEVLGANNN